MKLTGEVVAAKRKQLKLSRAEFAQRCGLTASKLWRIETKNEFKTLEREKIAGEFFGNELLDEATHSLEITPSLKNQLITATAGWIAPQSMPDEQLEALLPILEVPKVTVKKGGLKFLVDTKEFNEVLALPPTILESKPTFDYEANRYISHSEIATFQDCRRKWWLAYHRGLRPETESPLGALAMGTRIHKVLELKYAKYSVDPRDMLENLIVKDFTILSNQFNAKGEMISPEIKKKFDNEAKMQRVMIEGYLNWVEEDGTDQLYETIEPEKYVEVDGGMWHDSRALKFVGRIDRLVRRMSDGMVLFEDFKTAASIPALMKVLPINTQMKHYLMLMSMRAEQVIGAHEPPAGALYTILRKSMQTAAATPPFYARVEVYHNALEEANYRTAVGSTVSQIEAAEQQLAAGPLHHHGIVPPRPNNDCSWKCPFFSVCPMFDDGSHVESMLENHFVTGQALDYYNPTVKETE